MFSGSFRSSSCRMCGVFVCVSALLCVHVCFTAVVQMSKCAVSFFLMFAHVHVQVLVPASVFARLQLYLSTILMQVNCK